VQSAAAKVRLSCVVYRRQKEETVMRLAFAALFCVTAMLVAACSSGAAEPGSPDWCKNTPQDKQVEDPAAMAKCFEPAAS
jgi:hypothetical protein